MIHPTAGDSNNDFVEMTEKCAVFGVFAPEGTEAARLVFYGLWALQHRGQESSGIVSAYGKRLFHHRGAGLVSTVYHEEDFDHLPGRLAIGHNRYSTSGAADGAHIQPIIRPKHQIALAHNGNLPITSKLKKFLTSRGIDHSRFNDSDMMTEAINCFIDDGLALPQAVIEAFPLFTGAFSVVAMSPTTLVAVRDHCGIRPLSIGRLGDGYVIASETCALDTVGAEYVRDVKPGEMVVIREEGLVSRQLAKPNPKIDAFEFVYFARPDSVINGKNVNAIRQNLGIELAKEHKLDADVVIPVPDSSIPAALGYSQASGIPFEMALVKNRYIHRTFIRPTQELRSRDVKMKLNPIPELFKGKRVVLVDDSIVRGTTLTKIVAMVREAGAKEVHVLISSPPVRFPDFYGINTPTQTELIAAHNSIDEVCKMIGAESLGYLSYDGMIRSIGLPESKLCTACFSGVYPLSIGSHKQGLVYKKW